MSKEKKYRPNLLQSLVEQYHIGSDNKKIILFPQEHYEETKENKNFFENMSDGMPFFLEFLKDPIEYCNKNNCIIYSTKNINPLKSDNHYRFVNKIDGEKYIYITINIKNLSTHYIVTTYDEICDLINDEMIIQLDHIKNILSENEHFFTNELININGLLNDSKK
jgi:hypothetical protein